MRNAILVSQRLMALVLLLLCTSPVWAGGPRYVGGKADAPGVPFTWDNSKTVAYRTDLGGLGTLAKTDADQFTANNFGVWQAVPTVTLNVSKAGDLAEDVTGANIVSLLNDPQSDLNVSSAIVYDTDGSAVDQLFGAGASDAILGFAGIGEVASDGTHNRITLAHAVLNGKFIDGSPDALPVDKFREAFIHEFGHFLGLDHSQINVEVMDPAQRTGDNLAGLPTMFPYIFNTAPRLTLAPDDVAAISALYPTASFATTTGHIRGRILFSDGVTAAQGFNVIARRVNDPATPEDESRRIAASSVSGYLYTEDAGNPLVNNAGSDFGSRDQTLIGVYDIPGLPPGDYTVEVEAINGEFVGGSGLIPFGPLGFQFPLPGVCPREYVNSGESATDNCTEKTPITVPAGAEITSGTDIILNGTRPEYDSWEGAELRAPEAVRTIRRNPVRKERLA